jgi:hypothetical protein
MRTIGRRESNIGGLSQVYSGGDFCAQSTEQSIVGAWEECLDSPQCPLEEIVKKNLRFLVGVRHEIEHQMTSRIDDQIEREVSSFCIELQQ